MKRLITLALLITAATSHAAIYEFTTIDQGIYEFTGGHNPDFIHTVTGKQQGIEWRSFFAFDLSSIPSDERIVGLSFAIKISEVLQATDFDINNPVEFRLWDVATDFGALTTGTAGLSAFVDLGSGAEYGGVNLFPRDSRTTKGIELNANAISGASAARSAPFVLGSSLVAPAANEYVQSLTQDPNTYRLQVMTVPVPEPASMAVLGLGLAAFKRRRAVKK